MLPIKKLFNTSVIILILFLVHDLANAVDNTSALVKPSGNYSVGYQDFFIQNQTLCPDKFYSKKINEDSFINDQHCHEILIRVYYPSSKRIVTGDKYYQPYLESYNQLLSKLNQLSESEEKLLINDLAIETYTKAGLPPLISYKKLPVIVFMSGSGQSSFTYTNLISSLVSHGYIVIGINSIFANGPLKLPNGKVISWSDHYDDNSRLENLNDLSYVMKNISKLFVDSRVNSIMDYHSIGLLGHSMGAMNIADYIKQYNNPNVKAITLLDPGNMLMLQANEKGESFLIPTPSQPTLLLWSSNFKFNNKIYMSLKESDIEIILTPSLLAGSNFTNHENFSDFSTLQYYKSFAQPKIIKDLNVGNGNGYYIQESIDRYVNSFYNDKLLITSQQNVFH